MVWDSLHCSLCGIIIVFAMLSALISNLVGVL